jgi:hypothetical protein
MRMLRVILVLLSTLAPLAAGAQSVPLNIGGTTILFPVDPGEVRASTVAPEVFSFTQAALPTTNRLVESFYPAQDLRLVRSGEGVASRMVQVQVMRSVETHVFSRQEWEAGRPELARSMATIDLNALVEADQAETNRRLSQATGQDVEMRLGALEAPQVYSNTSESVRFQMVLPVQISVNDQGGKTRLAAAGAILPVRGKLLFVYVYQQMSEPGALAATRTRLDSLIRRLLALNSR